MSDTPLLDAYRELLGEPRPAVRGRIGLTEPVVLPSDGLRLGDYLLGRSAPVRVWRPHLRFPWGGLGNIEWGNCVPACACHRCQAGHIVAGTRPSKLTPKDGLGLYSQCNGFDSSQGPPGHNPTDRGTDYPTMLPVWKEHGIQGDRPSAWAYFTSEEDEAAQTACSEFVAVLAAMGLPNSINGQRIWDVPDSGPVGPLGWHAMLLVSYDREHWLGVTWGQLQLMTRRFFRLCGRGGQQVAVLDRDSVKKGGQDQSNIAWPKLLGDIAALH